MRGSTLTRVAAAAALSVLLAACGGNDDSGTTDPGQTPGTEIPVPGDEPPTEPATGPPAGETAPPDQTQPEAEPADEPAGDEPATGGDLEGIDVQPEGQELVLRMDGATHVIGLLDPEGESFYRYATIWPGSTRDDLTIVAVTMAEGMYDLRWLTFTDGEESEVRNFPTQYQPDTELAAAADVAPIPVFSPDGRSLAWLDWNAEGEVTLRTVGWSDGPGTGRTADDNAAFAMDGLPAGVQLQSWEAGSGDESYLHAVNDEGTTGTITIERQADGALAIGPDAVQQD